MPQRVDPRLLALQLAGAQQNPLALQMPNPQPVAMPTMPAGPRRAPFIDRLAGALFPAGEYGELLGEEGARAVQRRALMNFGMNLMANSGWRPAGSPGSSFGERLGTAFTSVELPKMFQNMAEIQELARERQAREEGRRVAEEVNERAKDIRDPAERAQFILGELAGRPGFESVIGPLSNAVQALRPRAERQPTIRTARNPQTGQLELYRIDPMTGQSQSLGLAAPPPMGMMMPSEGERRTGAQLMIAEDAYTRLKGAAAPTLSDAAAARAPFGAGQPFISGEQQLQLQSGMQLYRAWLVVTSGATVSDSEAEGAARTFLPQYGDTPALVRQKAASRDVMIRAIRQAAGRGAAPPAEDSDPVDDNVSLDQVPARLR